MTNRKRRLESPVHRTSSQKDTQSGSLDILVIAFVHAGLDHGNLQIGVLCQPSGQDQAYRPATNDDNVKSIFGCHSVRNVLHEKERGFSLGKTVKQDTARPSPVRHEEMRQP